MKIPKIVSLKCLFCGLELKVEEKIATTIKRGDQIKCNHCSELNDFDSMVKVAEEEALKIVELAVEKELDDMFK